MSDLGGRWPKLAEALARLALPVAIVDLETTGGNMLLDRVTEIAVLRFEEGRVSRHEWLVNPQMPISSFITGLTGISNEMVAEAPPFAEVAPDLLPMLRGSVVAAHNSRFDYTFLRHEFRRAGMDFAAPSLCTVQLSRRLYPEFHKHNLDSIIERCGMSVTGRHRAMADVLVLADFLERALAERGCEAFETQSRSLMNPKMLPSWLAPVLADRLYALPDSHGVLLWLDGNGRAIHIALHEKAFSETAQALGKAVKPAYAQLAAQVRFVPAVGGLHALWVKAQLEEQYGLQPEASGKTYLTVRFRSDEGNRLQARVEPLVQGRQQRPHGLFLHKKAARRALAAWAADAGLCPSALAIVPPSFARNGECPVMAAGQCGGTCRPAGGEAEHDGRVLAQAALLPVADWGRAHEIEVTETDALSGESLTFRCAGGALAMPDGSWYFDERLPALLKAKFKQGGRAVKVLG